MSDNWTHFKEIDFADEKIQQYHIDTRDFHCITHFEKSEKSPILHSLMKYKDDFFYSAEEVKNLLTRYFEESGGEKKWRCLYVEGINDWFKYIRIHRTEHGLLVCSRDNYALRKSLTCGKVQKDIL